LDGLALDFIFLLKKNIFICGPGKHVDVVLGEVMTLRKVLAVEVTVIEFRGKSSCYYCTCLMTGPGSIL